ncbi:MAG: hypothetical protein M3552_15655 [Planctomycetota bacterium]|nr:hypothetical protein [Planctomycetota bacterium]
MAKRRTIIRGGLLLTGLLLVPTCCMWSFQDNIGTSATVDRAAVSGLPPGATDISWFLPGAFGPATRYEFTIDEAGYEEWVRNRSRPKLEGPKRGPYRVYRYDRATRAVDTHELENTIAYTWNEEDRGVYFVYDLDGLRAYYWSHSR